MRNSQPVDPGDADVVAGGIEAFLTGAEDDLEAALGLRPGPGQRSWRSVVAREDRDALLRRAAAEYFPGSHPTEQAALLSTALGRYRATAWRRGERLLTQCPILGEGRIEALLWAVLKASDAELGARQLRRILATSS